MLKFLMFFVLFTPLAGIADSEELTIRWNEKRGTLEHTSSHEPSGRLVTRVVGYYDGRGGFSCDKIYQTDRILYVAGEAALTQSLESYMGWKSWNQRAPLVSVDLGGNSVNEIENDPDSFIATFRIGIVDKNGNVSLDAHFTEGDYPKISRNIESTTLYLYGPELNTRVRIIPKRSLNSIKKLSE